MTMSGRATVWNLPGTMYGHDVIREVRVHRDAHLGVVRPHGRKGLDHSTSVITLGKALSIHEAAFFEGGIGMQEPVGGDQLDRRVIRAPAKERLENSGGGALTPVSYTHLT